MNIKTMIAAAAIGAVMAGFGVPATEKPMSVKEKIKMLQAMSPEERAKYTYEHTGGQVFSEAKGKPFVVVDLRSAPGKVLETFAHSNTHLKETVPGLPIKTLTEARTAGDVDAAGQAAAIRDREDASLVVAIVNGGKSAGLTVLPEERVAVINADRYDGDDGRIHKEIWRSIGFIAGVGFSKYPADPMQPVFSVAELDKLTGAVLLPMSLGAMGSFNGRFDVSPSRRVPYIIAARQGWAHMPTNAVQRAIWEKVHAIPKNPMKIEYDPKKGR